MPLTFGPLESFASKSGQARLRTPQWTCSKVRREFTRFLQPSIRSAYGNISPFLAAAAIRDEGLCPEIPSDMPLWLQNIVQSCLVYDSKERITMAAISKSFRKRRQLATQQSQTEVPASTSAATNTAADSNSSGPPGSGGSGPVDGANSGSTVPGANSGASVPENS